MAILGGYSADSPGLDQRWGLFNTAPSLVENKFKTMREYSEKAYTNTMEALLALGQIAGQLELINVTIAIDTTPIVRPDISDLNAPSVDVSKFNVNYSQMPVAPNIVNAMPDPIPSKFPDLSVGEISGGNNTYVSTLLTALKSKLLSDLKNGSIGIPVDIQNDMWNKDYERSILEHEDSKDRIAGNVSRMGWPMPGGSLYAGFLDVELKFKDKRLDMSRDIAIKSFELALANSHFVIQQAVSVETMLINWTNAVANRVYQVTKATVDAQISAFNARGDKIWKQASVILQKAKAKMDYNLGLIQIFTDQVNACAAQMRAESERVNAVARGYEAETGVFNSIVNFESTKATLGLKFIQAKIDQAVANANILIKNKEIELKNYEVINSLKEEAIKASGQIAAQLVAGALASVSAQVQIGATDQATYSAKDAELFLAGLL